MARVALVGGFGDLVVKLRGTLVRDLRAAGHDVVVCVPEPSSEARDGVVAAIEAAGARLVVSPLDRAGTNPLSELSLASFYAGFMAAERPDAVLAYNPKPIFYAVPAARRAGVRRVVAMVTGLGHAFTATGLRARALAVVAMGLYRRSLPLADAVVFQNSDDEALFGRLGLLAGVREACRLPGSGVDLEHFAEVPLDGSGRPIEFLFVGRLLRDKGVLDFVEAARALQSLRIDTDRFRFSIAGFRDENPSSVTASEVKRWSESDGITMLGRLEDVRPALAACSVFVLPSHREGLPMSVLEAMATGRAVVTCDVPGCRETVVDGESGFIVPPRAPAALAVAMEQFLEQPSLAAEMGRAARRRAEERFDSRVVNREMIRVLVR
jgi:glycosyltransferase involved in cell wall biosynthesis